MLTKIRIQNFKQFDDVEIELGPVTVLIGPNNSGKTTILQALMLWYLGNLAWREGFSKINPYVYFDVQLRLFRFPSFSLNRLEITGLPIPSSNLIWHNLLNTVNFINIEVQSQTNQNDQALNFNYEYINEQSIGCFPEYTENMDLGVFQFFSSFRLVYLHSMSGLTSNEIRVPRGRIQTLIGEGRTSEVLRNICLLLHGDDKYWDTLVDLMSERFGVEILPPEYLPERGEITMSYRDKGGAILDISSAGRGMLQMLLLLAYMYNNPGSVLLLDEPDAHLEILRQREVYRLLVDVARELKSQVIIATHSEVIMNEVGEQDVLIAMVGQPRRIDDRAKSQVAKALKSIRFDDYYQALQKEWVLYLEGSTDFSILQTFALSLGHQGAQVLNRPFVHYIETNKVSKAEDHFYGLQQAYPTLRGLVILDRTQGRDSDKKGLRVIHWKRREIENYLCQPATLIAYAKDGDSEGRREETMQNILKREVTIAAFENPDHVYWKDTKVSEAFLPIVFEEFFKALNQPNLMRKTNFHVLARYVPVDLIDPEVIEKLDAIWDIAKDAPNT